MISGIPDKAQDESWLKFSAKQVSESAFQSSVKLIFKVSIFIWQQSIKNKNRENKTVANSDDPVARVIRI